MADGYRCPDDLLPPGAARYARMPESKARLLMITIGAPYDGFARDLSALYASGGASLASFVETDNRWGVRLEGN